MKSQDRIEDSKKIPKGRKINRDFALYSEIFIKFMYKSSRKKHTKISCQNSKFTLFLYNYQK